jgi:hypothetical protein
MIAQPDMIAEPKTGNRRVMDESILFHSRLSPNEQFLAFAGSLWIVGNKRSSY